MKRAEVINNRIHWVFNASDFPEPDVWPPYLDGTKPLIIDLTGVNEGAEEGDGYNPVTKKVVFKPRVALLEEFGYSPFQVNEAVWDNDNYTFAYSLQEDNGDVSTVVGLEEINLDDEE